MNLKYNYLFFIIFYMQNVDNILIDFKLYLFENTQNIPLFQFFFQRNIYHDIIFFLVKKFEIIKQAMFLLSQDNLRQVFKKGRQVGTVFLYIRCRVIIKSCVLSRNYNIIINDNSLFFKCYRLLIICNYSLHIILCYNQCRQ